MDDAPLVGPQNVQASTRDKYVCADPNCTFGEPRKERTLLAMLTHACGTPGGSTNGHGLAMKCWINSEASCSRAKGEYKAISGFHRHMLLVHPDLFDHTPQAQLRTPINNRTEFDTVNALAIAALGAHDPQSRAVFKSHLQAMSLGSPHAFKMVGFLIPRIEASRGADMRRQEVMEQIAIFKTRQETRTGFLAELAQLAAQLALK